MTESSINELFPSASKTIIELQQDLIYKGDDSKNTACTLQCTESRFFRKIWNLLLTNNIRFINAHDGIYIDQSNENITKELMVEVLT